MNNNRIKRGFDFLAPFYDFLVRPFFGNSIHKTQTYFLSEIRGANSVLIFGGGTGWILHECQKINPNASYCFVDISERMIEKAKCYSKNVQFICGSYNDIPDQEFDIILTPFVLDCFEEKVLKEEIVPSFSKSLKFRGKWIVSDFRYSNLYSKIVIRLLYFFFNLTTGLGLEKLPDFNTVFDEQCFSKKQTFSKGMLFSSIYFKK